MNKLTILLLVATIGFLVHARTENARLHSEIDRLQARLDSSQQTTYNAEEPVKTAPQRVNASERSVQQVSTANNGIQQRVISPDVDPDQKCNENETRREILIEKHKELISYHANTVEAAKGYCREYQKYTKQMIECYEQEMEDPRRMTNCMYSAYENMPPTSNPYN